MKSIINQTKECFICHTTNSLHLHHIIFGPKRKKADEDGLVVYLCREHHEGTKGVHGKDGHELDMYLKRIAEQAWLLYYNKEVEDFISRYGKNYL